MKTTRRPRCRPRLCGSHTHSTSTLTRTPSGSATSALATSWSAARAGGRSYYQTRADATAKCGLYVDVAAGIDLAKNEAYWTFTGIDPATGEMTQDVLAGFLPPNATSPEGEGWVAYSIKPLAAAQSGDLIRPRAEIVFDWNEPIATPDTFNTIDAGIPTSQVAALPATSLDPTFSVEWAGQDDANGSGLASYDVHVSDNGGPWQVWLTGMTSTSAEFVGKPGHAYAFYSVARDIAGNVEAAPGVADAADDRVQFRLHATGGDGHSTCGP